LARLALILTERRGTEVSTICQRSKIATGNPGVETVAWVICVAAASQHHLRSSAGSFQMPTAGERTHAVTPPKRWGQLFAHRIEMGGGKRMFMIIVQGNE